MEPACSSSALGHQYGVHVTVSNGVALIQSQADVEALGKCISDSQYPLKQVDFAILIKTDPQSENKINSLSPLSELTQIKLAISKSSGLPTSNNPGLEISDNVNLLSLSGLENLQRVEGHLNISGNKALRSLVGSFKKLTAVRGTVQVSGNDNLEDLFGFEKLIDVGGLAISGNKALKNLAGMFEDLTVVRGKVQIEGNEQLLRITGFNKLESIGFNQLHASNGGSLEIMDHDHLQTIDAFQKLEVIGGHLQIQDNRELQTIYGLYGLHAVRGNVQLTSNMKLEGMNINMFSLGPRGCPRHTESNSSIKGWQLHGRSKTWKECASLCISKCTGFVITGCDADVRASCRGSCATFEEDVKMVTSGVQDSGFWVHCEGAPDIYARFPISTYFKQAAKLKRIWGRLDVDCNWQLKSLDWLGSLTHISDKNIAELSAMKESARQQYATIENNGAWGSGLSRCMPGTFGVFGCAPCHCCDAGTSSSDWQAWSCEACSGNTYSDKCSMSCRRCPVGTTANELHNGCEGCPAGTIHSRAGNTCTSCKGNTFSTQGASGQVCQTCKLGTTANDHHTNCDLCEAGRYQNYGDVWVPNCKKCERHQVSKAKGASQCVSCQMGQVADVSGTHCLPCKPGKYSNDTDKYECMDCLGSGLPPWEWQYYFSGVGDSSCNSCPFGYVANSDASDCLAVLPGALLFAVGVVVVTIARHWQSKRKDAEQREMEMPALTNEDS